MCNLIRMTCWRVCAGAGLLACCALGAAQETGAKSGPWVLERSGTTASLRGIHAVGGGVAWASGTNGTVLRTEDGGYEWQSCSMPPGAEKLDFRGIWAWDDNTAIVMSSGPGDQSRLYRTIDGCSTWKLLLTNPDKDGFFDAVVFDSANRGFLLGDPVNGRFVLMASLDRGRNWTRLHPAGLEAGTMKIGAFAASNTVLVLNGGIPLFGTSGPGGPWLYSGEETCTMGIAQDDPAACLTQFLRFTKQRLPMVGDSAASGIFSLAISPNGAMVAVGGDYARPNVAAGTAACVPIWEGLPPAWVAAKQPPHGYRSAVAWDPDANSWIAAGPNGSDISYDDGKTWQPLDGSETGGNWNALSLPWVVGPNGRIAKLDPGRLKKTDPRRHSK